MSPARQIRVAPEESGQKLFQFLRRRLGKEVPGSDIMRWIRTGQIRVDSARMKPFDRIHEGQTVRIPPMAPQPSPEFLGKIYSGPHPHVLHEDDEILVLNKPARIPVHGGTGHKESMAAWLKHKYAHAGFLPTPVHRLDRDTTGVLVVAKTYLSLRSLQERWKSGHVLKVYLAWVQGRFPSDRWVRLSDLLEKKRKGAGERVLTGSGKTALAEAKPLAFRDHATLMVIVLETGRTHQIRVQLSSMGHCIVGDKKYGHSGFQGTMLLHCWHLAWSGHAFTVPPAWKAPCEMPRGIEPDPVLSDRPIR
ncbi:MAG: RluA family pseudouridine synthase [Desulfovibrionales bacterium]